MNPYAASYLADVVPGGERLEELGYGYAVRAARAPYFTSHKFRPWMEGGLATTLGDLKNNHIVINHLLNGMILQVY